LRHGAIECPHFRGLTPDGSSWTNGLARSVLSEVDLLQEQQVIYAALMEKYPELAQQLMGAMLSGPSQSDPG
jgi:hypothetical protein